MATAQVADAEQMADSQGESDSKFKESSTPRIRRRNRMITSCLECRRRKLKCDKLHPCSNCNKFSRDCMFLAPALDSVSQKKLNELKEKMGSLERVLEDDIARKSSRADKQRKHGSTDLPGEDSNSDPEAPVPDDEKQLEATPMVGFDAAYEDNADEDVLDVGIRIGLLRLTERIGGMFRPRLSEEMAIQLGAPIRRDLEDPEIPNLPDHEDFISPGPEYIVPGQGFLFGDVGVRRSLVDYLPTKQAADTLIRQYYQRCHFVARAVHWPSFQIQYENFWSHVLSGIEPPASMQAVVMATMFQAVVAMDDADIVSLFANPKSTVVTNFQLGTEVSLAKSNFLRTTKIETLQALVLYLIPMCRDALSRAHSVLIGSAIRLGECMGLHRDPTEHFGMSAVEAHVRRILWFQLCFLDFHTADKQGPRPTIRREDYDTRFPLNADDSALMTGKVSEDQVGWTDMTLSRIRFECCEMQRISRVDVERLHQKKITITHALGKIESFRRAMEAKYTPVLNLNVPIQRYAKRIIDSSTHKMHVATLHRYHYAVEISIPDRLRQIMIDSGTTCCEAAIEMYRDPDLSPWSWYKTAIFAWPTAALLALEVFMFPNRREADRIWAVLDFVFQTDPAISKEIKARQILSAIRDRTAFYRSLRGFRVPVSMQNRLDTSLPIRRQRVGEEKMLVSPPAVSENDKSPLPAGIPGIPPENSNQIRRGSTQSAKSSPKTQKGAPLKTEEGASNTWTMDQPHTFFVESRSPASQIRASSEASSASPPGTNEQYGFSNIAAHVAKRDGVSGVEAGNSPSNSSSNTENWPPPISAEQQAWRYAFTTPSPQQKQVPSSQPRHIAPQLHLAHQQYQNQPQPQASPQLQPHPQPQPPPPVQHLPRRPSQINLHTFHPSQINQMQMYDTQTGAPPNHIPFVPVPVGVVPVHRTAEEQPTFNASAVPNMQSSNLGMNESVVLNNTGSTNRAPQPGQDAPMLDINWAEWDKIFPPDVNHGNLDHPRYQAQR